MQDLIKQEQFELEVLDNLNSVKVLNSLVFGGGTMLRLCFGLDRFSVDLDFWVVKDLDFNKLFADLKEILSKEYMLKDCANKFYTILFELKSKNYPRSLKIEIRKETKKITTEQAIAYSRYSNQQVLLEVVSLPDMLKAKVDAFLERQEIRDVFDIEFLLKKGLTLDFPVETLRQLAAKLKQLKEKDYSVKLGSLLEEEKRQYYTRENFKILKLAIQERFSG
jgi:predicted nucleotidyltransferase component of viral defense system